VLEFQLLSRSLPRAGLIEPSLEVIRFDSELGFNPLNPPVECVGAGLNPRIVLSAFRCRTAICSIQCWQRPHFSKLLKDRRPMTN
jgi:hypothetical protein